LRAYLERQGKVTGATDVLNAAHALGAVLVTHSIDEFSRVRVFSSTTGSHAGLADTPRGWQFAVGRP